MNRLVVKMCTYFALSNAYSVLFLFHRKMQSPQIPFVFCGWSSASRSPACSVLETARDFLANTVYQYRKLTFEKFRVSFPRLDEIISLKYFCVTTDLFHYCLQFLT